MPFSYTLPDDLPIVETGFVGPCGAADISHAIAKTNELLETSGRRCLLTDCSGVERGYSPIDIHAMAEQLMTNPLVRVVRQAMILPDRAGEAEDMQFWETLCRNRGIMVRGFSDRASAIEWLLAGPA